MKIDLNITGIKYEIDKIDSEIIELLSRRSSLVNRAAKSKQCGKGVRDRKRVNEIIEKVKRTAAEKGLDPHQAESIYRSLIDCYGRKEVKESGEDRFYFPDI